MTTTKDGVALCLTQTRPTRPISKKLTNYVLEKENNNEQNIGSDGKPIVVGNTTLCNHASGNVYHPDGISRTLMAGNYKAPITIIEKENNHNDEEVIVDEVIGSTQKNAAHTDGTYSPALTCAMGQGGGHIPMIKQSNNVTNIARSVLTPGRVNGRQNGRRMKEDGEPSFTLTATDRHGVYDGFRIRRLTPLECERLQAFPDVWTRYGVDGELISDTQRYKCCGNAVTTSVISFLINSMYGDNGVDLSLFDEFDEDSVDKGSDSVQTTLF